MRQLWIAVGCMVGLLGGCNEDRIASICEKNPELCADLNDDGYCRLERSNVIRNRYYHLQDTSDTGLYHLMKSLEAYLVCIEKTTLIEYSERKERKNNRVEGMVAARRQLDTLDAQTRNSHEPHLLLWHWTNNGSQAAKEAFLKREGSPLLEEPELQLALANHYRSTDTAKAIQILQHALSLYKAEEEVDIIIPTALSGLYMKQQAYPQAYLWALVTNQLQGNKGAGQSPYIQLTKDQKEAMEEQAEQIVDQLHEGQYRPAG